MKFDPHLDSPAFRVAKSLAEGISRQVSLKSIASLAASYRAELAELAEALIKRGGKGEFRRRHKALIKEMAPKEWAEGWEEGGGDPDDIGRDESVMVDDFVIEQQAHVNDFSDWLASPDSDLDQVPNRLDLWEASIKNLGDIAKAHAQGDPALTFRMEGGATENGCDECDEFEGQTHKLSWWTGKNPAGQDYTKRNGNDAFGCGRWHNCPHHFYNRKGEMVIE